MSLGYVGPVAIDFHGDPEFSWVGDSTTSGLRAAMIGGHFDWPAAHQILELVDNPARRVTIGDATGVLDVVWFDDDLLRDMRGWYLLQAVTLSPQQVDSVSGCVPVSVAAMFVGDRQPVVVRSARARVNVFSLAGAEVLAAPLAVTDGNTAFVAEPGGTVVARPYDAAHGDVLFDAAPDGRVLQLRAAAVGSLASLILPTVEDDAKPPSWVACRGGDCRAFDIAEGRAVYGPSHPLAEPSDLVLDNGLIRAWCGPRGVVPYMAIAAFSGGAWHQEGVVLLAAETSGPPLDRARLITVTPDSVTAALSVRGQGDVYVTLNRGERMLRIQHGTTRAPTVSTSRRVQWSGIPPTLHGPGASTLAPGEFGTGLSVADNGSPLFQWPIAATQEAWSIRGAWVPAAASSSQPSTGLFTILDDDFAVVATAYFDTTTNVVTVEVDGDPLSTAPVTFAADDVVTWVARFDTVRGLAVSVKTPGGTVHASDASIVTPAGSERLRAYALWTAPIGTGVDWGDGDWGDGTWGGAIAPATPGVLDEVVIFAGRLTDTQVAALLNWDAQLTGLPSVPRPVWYAAFDTDIVPGAAALTSGRVVETTDDDAGFKRFAASLQTVTTAGLGVRATAAAVDLAAGLADGAAGNAAADMHNQLAAASQQETRIR